MAVILHYLQMYISTYSKAMCCQDMFLNTDLNKLLNKSDMVKLYLIVLLSCSFIFVIKLFSLRH